MTNEMLEWWIGMCSGLSNYDLLKILEVCGGPEALWHAKKETLAEKLTAYQVKTILKHRKIDAVKRHREKIEQAGITFMPRSSPLYPKRLLNIPDAPLHLYGIGRVEELNNYRRTIGIVGARKATSYGLDAAYSFASKLANYGVGIISGMALGIDGQAHRGALSAENGFTIAVLGCGIDTCYPRANIDIHTKLKSRGVILSEFCPGTPPESWRFPMRNRIISGLSDGILVIEAKEQSGSLITADAALEQGRDVYAIPGNIYDANSRGCNSLIRQGATCVTSPEDMVEDLGLLSEDEVNVENLFAALLTEEQHAIYKIIGKRLIYIEEICAKSGMKSFQVFSILYDLEKLGLIKQPEKGYFFRGI